MQRPLRPVPPGDRGLLGKTHAGPGQGAEWLGAEWLGLGGISGLAGGWEGFGVFRRKSRATVTGRILWGKVPGPAGLRH